MLSVLSVPSSDGSTSPHEVPTHSGGCLNVEGNRSLSHVLPASRRTPMRSMAVVDIKSHNGEHFASGVSNQEFCSILRRVAYPFTGTSSERLA